MRLAATVASVILSSSLALEKAAEFRERCQPRPLLLDQLERPPRRYQLGLGRGEIGPRHGPVELQSRRLQHGQDIALLDSVADLDRNIGHRPCDLGRDRALLHGDDPAEHRHGLDHGLGDHRIDLHHGRRLLRARLDPGQSDQQPKRQSRRQSPRSTLFAQLSRTTPHGDPYLPLAGTTSIILIYVRQRDRALSDTCPSP